MFKLIGNEYSKLFSRKTTQLLLLLLLLATIGLAFFFHLPLFNNSDSYETVASSSSGTEAAAEENTMSLEETLHARTEEAKLNYSQMKAQSDNGTPVDPSELEDAHNAYLIAQYIEDHQLESSLTFDSYGYPVTDSYLIRTLCQAPMLVTLLALVMIVVAGGIIANEFSQGTIKFLLINPVRRGKILWSKYLCCLSLLAGLFFLLFGLETLFLGFSYGFSAYGGQYVQVINGVATGTPILLYGFQQFLLASVNPLLMMTMAFAISSLFRSSALSIALGLGGLMGGSIITQILSQLGVDGGRYLPFSNTNLADIAAGTPYFPNQSLTFAVVTLIVYMVVFLLIAYDGFTRREV